jgi:antitoxin PrlF
VRAALRVREGDELCYEIDGDRVILTRANCVRDGEDPFGTFAEWNTDADREAYRDL